MLESEISYVNPTNSTFLIIDDNDVFRTRLSKAIASRGFNVISAGDVDLALELTEKSKPTHVVLDLRMPKKSGLDVLREIKKLHSSAKVLVLTGFGSIATAIEATKSGATNYLSKPANVEQILAAFKDQDTKLGSQQNLSVPSLPQLEWEHIQRVLHEECGGNVSKAAKMLRMHRRSLQRKLKSPPQ